MRATGKFEAADTDSHYRRPNDIAVGHKGFTVRLDDDQAEELEAIAKVDGVPVAEDLAHAGRLDLAESALHAPAAAFGGVEFYPTWRAGPLCLRTT